MVTNRILDRLNSLISMGEKVLVTRLRRSVPGIVAPDSVENASFYQWRISSLAFLNTLPPEYVYRAKSEVLCKGSLYDDAVRGMAVLQAAKDDIEGGYLQKVETLVSASVFSDFLEMAEHLLDNGYKDPVASLTGAVLEMVFGEFVVITTSP